VTPLGLITQSVNINQITAFINSRLPPESESNYPPLNVIEKKLPTGEVGISSRQTMKGILPPPMDSRKYGLELHSRVKTFSYLQKFVIQLEIFIIKALANMAYT